MPAWRRSYAVGVLAVGVPGSNGRATGAAMVISPAIISPVKVALSPNMA